MAKRQLQSRELAADSARQASRPARAEVQLAILIGSALLVQIFVKYCGQVLEPLHWGMFYWATAASRIAVLLIVCGAFGISLWKLGLGKPRLSHREAAWILAVVVAATLVALPVLGMQSYQNAYKGIGNFGTSGWLSFLTSTTFSWELFFRGFVLFGVRELLRTGGRGADADTLAILITACFEVLSHLPKPPEEALAMLVGSPAMSWLALRHQSIWIPAAGHVWIEFLWFMSVWR